MHPALLDACFQSVAAHPSVRSACGGLLLPLGVRRLRAYGSVRNARYCYTTVTECGSGVEADLDIVDEHGTVLLAVRGLQMGTGASPSSERDRVLGERLLTIEWQQRELPETTMTEPGTWLLISTSDATDMLATALTDALKVHDAQCTTLSWPQHGRPCSARGAAARPARGRRVHRGGACSPRRKAATPTRSPAVRGGEYVKHVVRIARELPEIAGQPPRLYVLTRNAQTVLADDRANLEQGGLRGLLRVIGTEHPHLKVTYIDVDEHDRHRAGGAPTAAGHRRRRDRLAQRRVVHRPAVPDSAAPRGAPDHRRGPRARRHAPADPHPRRPAKRWSSRRSTGCRRVRARSRSRSARPASTSPTSWSAFGRYQTFDGQLAELGLDFAGVVTAVGPDVTDHKVGDHVGGLSPNGCWATFVTCDARLAATMPDGLTDAQAAAVTTASATAWYGLQDLARIRAGDKVLIHSATGGVGQAAIAIARAAGAEIFATAGSEKRREMLRDMGIEHVYDSRSVEFAEQIRRDTDGYGVDIVLNSLTGAAQLAGIKLLALGGRFIEIGKRDIYSNTRLGAVPVPAEPGVLRRRPGVDGGEPPRRGPRVAEHGVPADRRGRAADAARAPTTRWPTRPPRSG